MRGRACVAQANPEKQGRCASTQKREEKHAAVRELGTPPWNGRGWLDMSGRQESGCGGHGGLGGTDRAFLHIHDLGRIIENEIGAVVKLQGLSFVIGLGPGCFGNGRSVVPLLQLGQPAFELGLARGPESGALNGLDIDQHLFRGLAAIRRFDSPNLQRRSRTGTNRGVRAA